MQCLSSLFLLWILLLLLFLLLLFAYLLSLAILWLATVNFYSVFGQDLLPQFCLLCLCMQVSKCMSWFRIDFIIDSRDIFFLNLGHFSTSRWCRCLSLGLSEHIYVCESTWNSLPPIIQYQTCVGCVCSGFPKSKFSTSVMSQHLFSIPFPLLVSCLLSKDFQLHNFQSQGRQLRANNNGKQHQNHLFFVKCEKRSALTGRTTKH